MAEHVLVSGAGFNCNGEYKPLYEAKTGFDRVWMLDDNYRLYYNNGWRIANRDVTNIYYKLVDVVVTEDETIPGTNGLGISNPWDKEDCQWIATSESYSPVPTLTLNEVSDTVVEEYAEEEEDGSVTHVRKITNTLTGDTRYERTTYREVETPVITSHDRYYAPMLTLGRVYQFSFVGDFADLGYNPEKEDEHPLKGIYKVERMMSYFDLATTGIDLYKNLYEPLGLSRILYETDVIKLEDMMVYKLVNVFDETISYYMPMMFILGTPNSRVNQYNKVALSMKIGEHFDLDMLTDMQEIFKDVLEARWGIRSDVDIIVYDKVWMTEDYYEKIMQDREEIKKLMYQEHGDVLADKLFFVQSNKLHNENNELKAKIASYEEILEQQLP